MFRSRGDAVFGWCAAAVLAAATSGVVRADVTSFNPAKDNSIYSEPDTSNGQGEHLFAGQTGFETLRRALVQFNLFGTVNPGSTVSAVSLRVRCSHSPAAPPMNHTFTLHRLTSSWGEGASDAGDPEGLGAPAAANDATWNERFFGQGLPWTAAGGDFVATPSASFVVGACSNISPYTLFTIASTPQLVADVQAWVNNPSSNFGWILVGNEATTTTARRFASRNHPTTSVRPILTVTYTLAPAGPGTVPNGDDVAGVPLLLGDAGGGQILLDWSSSCSSGAVDYEVYEGSLGNWTSHAFALCTTGGLTTATITPMISDSYYLVVPRTATQEGSYGRDSMGAERPPGAPQCLPQNLVGSACP